MKKLPNIPESAYKIQAGVDRVVVLIEPMLPKVQLPKNVHLTDNMKRQFMEDFEVEMSQRRLQVSSLRRCVVISVPVDLDPNRFSYKVGDIVAVPNETNNYDVINIERTPLYLVGTRDIRLVLPELSEEEVAKWNEDHQTWIDTIVYPPAPLDSPGPRIGKGGLEGFTK